MINQRRVAIVGTGVVSPLGNSVDEMWQALAAGKSGVVSHEPWQDPSLGLSSSYAAPARDFDVMTIPRKFRRSMSRIAMLAYEATSQAVKQSEFGKEELASHRTGVFYGSCMGGLESIDDYYRKVREGGGDLVQAANATTFLRIMPHTCAANLAVAFGVGGRINASCTACAAGTQGIGFGYEAIKYGLVDRAICGGAEELSPAVGAIFDALGAIQSGEEPEKVPRPFDSDRSGIVVGEGAGTVVLEDYESAVNRGVPILGEIAGFFSYGDGFHMTNPSPVGLTVAMTEALKDWGPDRTPDDIDYINAHAAGTINGDRVESLAIENVFGNKVPVSSTKGQMGHMMGGTGAIETIASLSMIQNGVIVPTKNHDDLDGSCGNIDYVRGNCRTTKVDSVMKNSFAFGGVNACLVIVRV